MAPSISESFGIAKSVSYSWARRNVPDWLHPGNRVAGKDVPAGSGRCSRNGARVVGVPTTRQAYWTTRSTSHSERSSSTLTRLCVSTEALASKAGPSIGRGAAATETSTVSALTDFGTRDRRQAHRKNRQPRRFIAGLWLARHVQGSARLDQKHALCWRVRQRDHRRGSAAMRELPSVKISSTRRFDCRPDALSLLATGKFSPLPAAVI